MTFQCYCHVVYTPLHLLLSADWFFLERRQTLPSHSVDIFGIGWTPSQIYGGEYQTLGWPRRVMVIGSGTWPRIRALSLNLLHSLESKSSYCLIVKPESERYFLMAEDSRERSQHIGKQSKAKISNPDDII